MLNQVWFTGSLWSHQRYQPVRRFLPLVCIYETECIDVSMSRNISKRHSQCVPLSSGSLISSLNSPCGSHNAKDVNEHDPNHELQLLSQTKLVVVDLVPQQDPLILDSAAVEWVSCTILLRVPGTEDRCRTEHWPTSITTPRKLRREAPTLVPRHVILTAC